MFPERHRGRLPLIVFLHGINGSAADDAPFLRSLAASGYVVAAPDSPETTGGTGLANIEDFTVLPGDARFVIGRLTAGARDVPAGLVNPREVAVAGHSFGGAGVYGIGFNTCCRDTRIAAALSFEGALLPYPNGSFVWRGPPLLMVVGTRDPLIPLPIARKTLAAMRSPAYLLTLAGADHTGGLEPGDVGHAELLSVVREFLAATLGHDARARAWLARRARQPGTGLAGAHLGASGPRSGGTAR
jgi:pimeloyl-ACP methyl ester carboxylesterase